MEWSTTMNDCRKYTTDSGVCLAKKLLPIRTPESAPKAELWLRSDVLWSGNVRARPPA
jgi:hypothetical protein